jgi:hypothetical protein
MARDALRALLTLAMLGLAGCWQVASTLAPLAGSVAGAGGNEAGYQRGELELGLGVAGVHEVGTRAGPVFTGGLGARWGWFAALIEATPTIVPALHTTLVPVLGAARLHLGPMWLQGSGGLCIDADGDDTLRYGGGGGAGYDFYVRDWRAISMVLRAEVFAGDARPLTIVGGTIEVRY